MSAAIDWSTVGGAITAIGIGVGAVWAWWQKTQRTQATTRAEIAEAKADEVVADAQQTVYKLMVQRLSALEDEMRAVRDELARERQHNRRLTMRIWELEGLMHQAGITIPPFLDSAPAAG